MKRKQFSFARFWAGDQDWRYITPKHKYLVYAMFTLAALLAVGLTIDMIHNEGGWLILISAVSVILVLGLGYMFLVYPSLKILREKELDIHTEAVEDCKIRMEKFCLEIKTALLKEQNPDKQATALFKEIRTLIALGVSRGTFIRTRNKCNEWVGDGGEAYSFGLTAIGWEHLDKITIWWQFGDNTPRTHEYILRNTTY